MANIAPSAIRMPTLAAVVPNPLVNDSSTFSGFSPATLPTIRLPKINARNGCSLATVINAMPAIAARINCRHTATGCG